MVAPFPAAAIWPAICLPPSYEVAVCRNSVTDLTSELPDGVQVQVFTKVGVTCAPAATGTPTAAPTWAGVNTVHASVSARAAEDRAAVHNQSGIQLHAPRRHARICPSSSDRRDRPLSC